MKWGLSSTRLFHWMGTRIRDIFYFFLEYQWPPLVPEASAKFPYWRFSLVENGLWRRSVTLFSKYERRRAPFKREQSRPEPGAIWISNMSRVAQTLHEQTVLFFKKKKGISSQDQRYLIDNQNGTRMVDDKHKYCQPIRVVPYPTRRLKRSLHKLSFFNVSNVNPNERSLTQIY